MPKSHPPYPPEFRRRMVELVRAGRKPEALAKEFEPTAQSIHNWVAQAAFSRRIMGWVMETHLRTELVLEALNMALWQRRPSVVIHHSDQGCQYTSIAFGKRCKEAEVRPSTGSVGDCFDNALCESFFTYLGV